MNPAQSARACTPVPVESFQTGQSSHAQLYPGIRELYPDMGLTRTAHAGSM